MDALYIHKYYISIKHAKICSKPPHLNCLIPIFWILDLSFVKPKNLAFGRNLFFIQILVVWILTKETETFSKGNFKLSYIRTQSSYTLISRKHRYLRNTDTYTHIHLCMHLFLWKQKQKNIYLSFVNDVKPRSYNSKLCKFRRN